MIFLLTQMLLGLAIAALMGGAIGWLLHRHKQRRYNEALRQTLARQQRHLNQAQSEVALLTEEFDDLREQSAKQIEALEEENQQVPLLTTNLEKSQLLVRQMIQRHDVKQRELTLKNERLATRIQQLEQQQNLQATAQAERDRLMRESMAQRNVSAGLPSEQDPDNSEFGDSPSELHAAVMDADFEPGGPGLEPESIPESIPVEQVMPTRPVAGGNQDSAPNIQSPASKPPEPSKPSESQPAVSKPNAGFKITQKSTTPNLTSQEDSFDSTPDGQKKVSSGSQPQTPVNKPKEKQNNAIPVKNPRNSGHANPVDKATLQKGPSNAPVQIVGAAGEAEHPAGSTSQAIRYAAAESPDDPFDEVMELDDDVQISFDTDQSDFAPSPSGESRLSKQSDVSHKGQQEENLEDAAAALANDSDHPLLDGSTDTSRLFDPVNQHDDLQKIFGIGPVTEKALNKLGITSYSQLAELQEHEIEKIASALDIVPGRIQRDNWVGSARRQLEDVLEQL